MGSVDMLELFLSEFEGLCRIPRPSGGERKICGYLARRLTEMGYSPVRDEHYNLFCDIPPTKGIPETPPLAMQAHTDMVCVGAEDYMPERDPIHTEIRDGWLCSDGRSTLGADCGAGVAAILVILRSGMPHGALRLIFTANEEMGLVGARQMQTDVVRDCVGLINLDGFHGDRAVISSAGGYRLIFRRSCLCFPPMLEQAYRIEIDGLRGGHSGDDIGEGRANAARLLLWLLQAIEVPYELAEIDARGAFNVIRTSGSAVIVTDEKNGAELENVVGLFRQGIRELYRETDPDIRIRLEKTELPAAVFPVEERDNFLALAGIIPCGIDEMHPICPDCVGSSGNLASFCAAGGDLELRSFLRSCSNQYLDEHGVYYREVGRSFGYEEEEMRYPAWPGDAENPMAKRCIDIAARQGRHMEIGAVHAGLETSVFHMLRPEMPVISLGGDVLDPHTVRERLRLSSAAELIELLREMVVPLPAGED